MIQRSSITNHPGGERCGPRLAQGGNAMPHLTRGTAALRKAIGDLLISDEFLYKNTLAVRAAKIIKNNEGCIFKTIFVNRTSIFVKFIDYSGS